MLIYVINTAYLEIHCPWIWCSYRPKYMICVFSWIFLDSGRFCIHHSWYTIQFSIKKVWDKNRSVFCHLHVTILANYNMRLLINDRYSSANSMSRSDVLYVCLWANLSTIQNLTYAYQFLIHSIFWGTKILYFPKNGIYIYILFTYGDWLNTIYYNKDYFSFRQHIQVMHYVEYHMQHVNPRTVS